VLRGDGTNSRDSQQVHLKPATHDQSLCAVCGERVATLEMRTGKAASIKVSGHADLGAHLRCAETANMDFTHQCHDVMRRPSGSRSSTGTAATVSSTTTSEDRPTTPTTEPLSEEATSRSTRIRPPNRLDAFRGRPFGLALPIGTSAGTSQTTDGPAHNPAGKTIHGPVDHIQVSLLAEPISISALKRTIDVGNPWLWSRSRAERSLRSFPVLTV